MNIEEQIDYMISSLELAKQEIAYAQKYQKLKTTDKDFYKSGHLGYDSEMPNGTIIRESLKMVGRLANRTANQVVLSPYNENIFKK